MDNAAKALQIAGSVLIGLLVITLVVFAYRKLSDVKQVEDDAIRAEQAVEFNKRFDRYNKNVLYGSELLSLANQIVDYDARESDVKGYEPIDFRVTINSSGHECFTPRTYGSAQDFVDTYNRLSERIKEGSTNQSGYYDNGKSLTYYDLSIMDLNRAAYIMDKSTLEARNKLYGEYTKYLDEQSAISRMEFVKDGEFEYDQTSGRVVLMHFRER